MRQYLDIHGAPHERPEGAPAIWRIGGYGVIERDGSLLMVETILPSRWRWDLPDGDIHLDPEETILEGIAREMLEETGYQFSPDATTPGLVDDAFMRPPSGAYWHILTFAVRGSVGADPDPDWVRTGDEISQLSWVDPGTLRRSDMVPPHWNLLERLGYVSQ